MRRRSTKIGTLPSFPVLVFQGIWCPRAGKGTTVQELSCQRLLCWSEFSCESSLCKCELRSQPSEGSLHYPCECFFVWVTFVAVEACHRAVQPAADLVRCQESSAMQFRAFCRHHPCGQHFCMYRFLWPPRHGLMRCHRPLKQYTWLSRKK